MTAKLGQAQWILAALGRYESPLLRFATRLTGNVDIARDVVQETFLRLCQADGAKVEDHVASWLYTVCRNQALDILRKDRRVQPLEQTQEPATPDPGPAKAAETQQELGAAQRVVARLSENQQEVVRLKFEDGLSYKEISQVTGHSVSNVGVLLHTAIGKIRAALTEGAAVALSPVVGARAGRES